MAIAMNTIDSMNNNFKPLFADQINRLIPENEFIVSNIPFISADKMAGGSYEQPVLTGRMHGFTIHGTADQVLRLVDAKDPTLAKSSVRPCAMTGRTMISYAAASRASSSKKAFVEATAYLTEGLITSHAAVQEQMHWYGGMGLGKVTSTGAGNLDTTNNWIIVDIAEWAAAIWVGGEGMPVELWTASSRVLSTSISKVDIVNRKIFLESSAGLANSNTYTIYRAGTKGIESVGLHFALQNTSAVIYGIDPLVVPMWSANSVAVGGALNFTKVAQGVAAAYGRGLMGKLTLLVNSQVFATLMPDFNTLKASTANVPGIQFSENKSALEVGVKSIKYIVNNVELEVVASEYCKVGYAFGIDQSTWKRIGSAPVGFDIPGRTDSGKYFNDVSDFSAVELRSFSDEGLFCDSLARNVYFSGITI